MSGVNTVAKANNPVGLPAANNNETYSKEETKAILNDIVPAFNEKLALTRYNPDSIAKLIYEQLHRPDFLICALSNPGDALVAFNTLLDKVPRDTGLQILESQIAEKWFVNAVKTQPQQAYALLNERTDVNRDRKQPDLLAAFVSQHLAATEQNADNKRCFMLRDTFNKKATLVLSDTKCDSVETFAMRADNAETQATVRAVVAFHNLKPEKLHGLAMTLWQTPSKRSAEYQQLLYRL